MKGSEGKDNMVEGRKGEEEWVNRRGAWVKVQGGEGEGVI